MTREEIKDILVTYIRENAEQLVTATMVQQAMMIIAENYIHEEDKGVAGGVAPLNDAKQIDAQYLPSYVDDVLEYDTYSEFPQTGEEGKIYVAIDTGKSYRWSGSAYVPLGVNTANDLPADTANFGGIILSSTDDTVQKALDKIDDTAAVKTLSNVSPYDFNQRLAASGGITKDVSFTDRDSVIHEISLENGLVVGWNSHT